jgi:thiamine kinase-like enzyme
MSRDSRQKFIESIRSRHAFEESYSSLFEIDLFKQVCSIADPFIEIENFKLYCQGLLSESTTDEVLKKCSLSEKFTTDEAGKFGDIYFNQNKTLLLKMFKTQSNDFIDICNELFIYLFLTFIWRDKAVFPRIYKWNCEFVMMEFVQGTPLKNISEIQRNRNQFGNLVKSLSVMSILGISHGDLNHGNILVGSDDKIFLLDFGYSKIDRPLNDIKKFDLGDIHCHFKTVFTADENKLIQDIIKDEDDPTCIYNTLNSLFHENGGIIVRKHTTTGKLLIVDYPCKATFEYINGELIISSVLEGCTYSLSRKNAIPKMLMNDDGTCTLQEPATIKVLQVNNDDIWKNRTVFISQFAKNVLHDNVLFEENSYIHVSSTPTALRKINDAFLDF